MTKPTFEYSCNAGAHEFQILSDGNRGFWLLIDGEQDGHYDTAEDAANECAHVGVERVVRPINPEKNPGLVSTKVADFPKDLGGWRKYLFDAAKVKQ
jgi:hypothetical protein